MKKLFAILALLGAVGWCAPIMAQDKPAATAPAPTAAPAAAAAPAAGAAAAPSATAAPAPTPNKGDVAWMLTSTALVLMMTVPALALFYGGLVRSKNMLSVCMQVFCGFALITVLWCVYGYSLAFTEGNPYFGYLSRLFLKGTFDPATGNFSMGATFSKATPLPELVFVAFQATFAAITCCPPQSGLRPPPFHAPPGAGLRSLPAVPCALQRSLFPGRPSLPLLPPPPLFFLFLKS